MRAMSVRPPTRRILRVAALVLGLVLLVKWQIGFSSAQSFVDDRYRVTASTGINREPQFVFYLYHLGLFPVATDAKVETDTNAEALRLLRAEPKSLKQDEGSTFRSGDRGRTFLYLIDCWMRKKALDPSIRPAHAIAFTFAIGALFVAFWSVRRSAQGLILCVLLGSNSFQLFATYRQENVFSWSITAMVLLLALNLPSMLRPSKRAYLFAAAFASGATLALIRTVRSEPTTLLLGVLIVYATAQGVARAHKGIAIGVAVLTFSIVSWGSLKYLDAKLARSKEVVASVGGSAYAGPVVAYHEFWHAVFCGLGDFDTEKGYVWDDRVPFRYAMPVMKQAHPDLPLDPEHNVQPWTYDKAGKYPVFFSEVEGYHDIIRNKIVADIKTHPSWYLRILRKRLWRVLTETTPVGIATHEEPYQITGALIGLACVPLLLFLIVARRWFLLKLLLFSTPLSIAPLAVYSDGGMANYSTYHIFGVFILGLLAWEGCAVWWASRNSVSGERRDSSTVDSPRP